MKTRRLNPKMIVSFEIHKEHTSERYSIRPEQIATRFFGLFAIHQDRVIVDNKYQSAGTVKYQHPWEFLKQNSDRYEISDDLVICKTEVKLTFVDGQTAKFYFIDYESAILWVKSLPLANKLDTWIQAFQQY
jgi:hypothetical protein